MGKQKFHGCKLWKIVILFFMINFLLNGCSLFSQENNERDKLYEGISLRNLEFVKEAVDNGCNINSFKNTKERIWDNYAVNNPLLVSIFNNSDSITEYLINAGADVNYICDNGKSILYYIIEFNNVEYCKTLIDHGADINFVSKNGKSVLQCALETNQKSVVYMLLNNENIDVSNEDIETVITLIKSNGYLNDYGYLKKMLEHNNNVDSQIYDAIFECKNLLNTNIKDENRDIIINCVAAFGTSDILDNIINDTNVDIQELYLIACQYNNIDNVKYFLSKGININTSDSSGLTAIEIAVKNNSYDVINYLFNNGVAIKGRKDSNYEDILCYAVENDNYEITKFLLEKYSDSINIDKALSIAVEGNNLALKAMIETGVDVNYVFYEQSCVLSYACLFGNAECTKLLLDYGADVNGLYGEPLITAVQYSRTDCVKLLCDYGADLQYNINNGGDPATALYYAIQCGNLDIAEILIKHGAKFKDDYEVDGAMQYAEKSININNFLKDNNLVK